MACSHNVGYSRGLQFGRPYVQHNNFKYCPRCGHDSFIFDGLKKFRCTDCEFTFYFNPAAAVAAVIVREGCLLAAVRAKDPGEGLLDLPGGFVDPGEAADTALARELREELGVEPSLMHYMCSSHNVYHYRQVDYTICDVFYRCEFPPDAEFKADDDIAALRWIKISELDPNQFAFVSARTVIERLRSE
ncbi:MAG: NUDIX domain-containing protein [Pseudomonadota bacterium]